MKLFYFLSISLITMAFATIENEVTPHVCLFHEDHLMEFDPSHLDNYTTRTYPQDYFRSPIRHTIKLAGTFGELRPNHFHSGIDIKSSTGGTGDQLFAVADGQVVRIRSNPGGFGKAMYIRHPNGFTSVYAHMDEFTKELEAYVKSKQYARKSFSVDLYPEAGQFTFKKGDIIGRMGNTGSSQGPHLHFEIRDAATEKPVNPLLFGFVMQDTQAPKMHQIKVYHLNDRRETIGSKVYDLSRRGTQYKISGDTLVIGAWRAGFGLKVYDHHDGVPNWNGIYSLAMYQDDQLIYDFDMESFSFSETRYINAHLDYAERVANKAYFNRCYQLPGNRLSIYNKKENAGIIPLHEGKASKIVMLAKDANGNESKLTFWVKRGAVKPAKSASFNYKIPFNETKSIELGSIRLDFSRRALYENLYLSYKISETDKNSFYAPIHEIHDYKTAIHKYYEIAIKPTMTIPDKMRSKAFIAHIDKKGEIHNYGGAWKDGRLCSSARTFGKFTIKVDDVPPKVSPIAFATNMKGYNKMTFKITDNYETGGKAPGLKYSATVDGQWILMEYDAKNDMLIHRFDDRIGAGSHTLKLTVRDNRQNVTVLERQFTR